MYLAPDEARDLIAALEALLIDPEANEHEHIFQKDHRREISVSLITPSKLDRATRYTKAEQEMFREK
jgi:hypothetical protein